MKKNIGIFILSGLMFTGCNTETPEAIQKNYTTVQVQTGSILSSQEYIGYVSSSQTTPVSGKVGGKITSLYKNIGDQVEVGEVVALLDTKESASNYTSSENIIQDLFNLKQATISMYDSQINAGKNKLIQAKQSSEITQIGAKGTDTTVTNTQANIESQLTVLENQIQAAESQIDILTTQQENTIITLNQKEKDIFTNGKNAITQANILANNSIDFLDGILGVTEKNKYKNDDFEIYLGAKDGTLKTTTENQFRNLIKKFETLQTLGTENKTQTITTLESYINFFGNDFRNLLGNSYSLFENSLENSYLPQSTLEEYKSSVTNFQNKNEQIILSVSGNYMLGLKGSLDAIQNFDNEKKLTLDTIEKQILSAQKQKQTLLATKQQIITNGTTQIDNLYTQSEIAQKQLLLQETSFQEIQENINSLEKQKQARVAEIESQISQIQSGKNTSALMIENGKVTSGIRGVITEKLAEIGTVVGAGTPIFTVSNIDDIKINVSFPDDIISHLHIGKIVEVEIPGYDTIFTGSISNIFPEKDTLTKKTIGEIKIDTSSIPIGSYAKIYIDTTSENNNDIIIPNSAILGKYMTPQVFILKNGSAQLKHIEIIKQNTTFSQVNGLDIGDMIITSGKENIFDGEKLVQ